MMQMYTCLCVIYIYILGFYIPAQLMSTETFSVASISFLSCSVRLLLRALGVGIPPPPPNGGAINTHRGICRWEWSIEYNQNAWTFSLCIIAVVGTILFWFDRRRHFIHVIFYLALSLSLYIYIYTCIYIYIHKIY